MAANVYVMTCMNRPVKTDKVIKNCIIHDLTAPGGAVNHRNVIMREARARGEKEIWMLDDDIEKIYKRGQLRTSKKTGKQYPSKEETILDLNDIQFPPGTAIGGISKGIFPFSKNTGFCDIQTSAAQLIYINLELLGDYELPVPADGITADDGELTAYAFHKRLGVKKSLDYSYLSDNTISDFSSRRVQMWFYILNIYKQYDVPGADPRIKKAWKAMLKQGPWDDPAFKKDKTVYNDELIRRDLISV
jgi:hypothetical protein